MKDINSINLKSEPHFDLDHFFELTADILCIASYDGYIKKANPAFSELLGYSTEEIMAGHVSDFIYHEDKTITSKLRESINKDKPLLNFENRYVTKSGEIVWLSWTSVSEPSKRLIYAIAKNVTHLKNLEEERNLLLTNLTSVNEQLKQFTYTISHDLRSPVNNMISLFGLLDLSKIEDQETLEYIDMLKKSSFKLKSTLNEYVDNLSQEEKINLKIEKVLLHDILEITLDSIKTLISNSKATLEIDFSEAEEVRFNAGYLQSIFLNLISNSIKYSNPKTFPVISITSRKFKNYTQLIFTDNGIGFEMKNVKDKIFGLHQKFHNHIDSKGIGLYLVQKQITSLGGTIKVKSQVNLGTTFTLTFKESKT